MVFSVANATADLLIMGVWSCVLTNVQAEPIPVSHDHSHTDRNDEQHQTYYFARDDRVFKAFQERLQEYKSEISRTSSKRLKWQLRVLERALDGRMTSYHVRCLVSSATSLLTVFSE